MHKQELKIPKMRIAILVGTNGETRKKIENRLEVKLNVSKEGEIEIQGKDPLNTFLARKIVKAIGRGFPPDTAMLLIRESYDFELFELRDFGNTKKDFLRLKGRVIGEKGRSRKKIENITGCRIRVFGKTIGIIGPLDRLDLARRAVSRLLKGAKHGSVFKFLEEESKK
jgi:ribosomal RNA assembly protein